MSTVAARLPNRPICWLLPRRGPARKAASAELATLNSGVKNEWLAPLGRTAAAERRAIEEANAEDLRPRPATG